MLTFERKLEKLHKSGIKVSCYYLGKFSVTFGSINGKNEEKRCSFFSFREGSAVVQAALPEKWSKQKFFRLEIRIVKSSIKTKVELLGVGNRTQKVSIESWHQGHGFFVIDKVCVAHQLRCELWLTIETLKLCLKRQGRCDMTIINFNLL